MVDSFYENVDVVNSGGGLTVYGWDKRGFIIDVSILSNDSKEPSDNTVLSQEISTKVVHLHPSKKYYLGLWSIPSSFCSRVSYRVVVPVPLLFCKLCNAFIIVHKFF